MKFSIITVTYNCKDTINHTIDSVLSQSFDDFEYIIVDGDSQDGTLDIIKDYAKKDVRIRYISEKDDGIYYAMNKGVRMSSGDFIGILNSDDAYFPETLERIDEHIDICFPHQIIYGITMVMNGESVQELSMRSHQYLKYGTICHQSIFVSRRIHEDYGLYDTSFRYVADYDFMVRMSQLEEVVFIPVYELIVKYRTGGVSVSKSGNIEYLKLMKKYGFIPMKSYYLQRLKILLLGV